MAYFWRMIPKSQNKLIVLKGVYENLECWMERISHKRFQLRDTVLWMVVSVKNKIASRHDILWVNGTLNGVKYFDCVCS